MATRDPRIDQYIERAADFARPVLAYLREVVHEADPEVEEAMKWSMPAFLHGGIVCSMAAFKQHATFSFWKGSQVVEGAGARDDSEAMGQFGRLTSVDDLPPRDVLVGYVRKAVALNQQGAPRAPRKATPKGELVVPDYLDAALDAEPAARAHFDRFSTSQKREYVTWLGDAKTEPTRQKRLAQALEWIAEGKPRNWKYEKR